MCDLDNGDKTDVNTSSDTDLNIEDNLISPILVKEVKYLKTCLDEAKTLEIDAKIKTDHSIYPNLGKVFLYNHLNMGPTVEFTPKCLQEIAPVDYAKMAGHASEAIIDLGYLGALDFEQKIDYNDPGFQLTYSLGTFQRYMININEKVVRIHDEEGIELFQVLWEKYLK